MIEIFAPLTSEVIPILQKIEIASSFQIPSFHIIGLPAPEVNEARERVHSAIEASGFSFPKRRIVLNLSPAHLHKKGTGIDLAIALGILNHSACDFQAPHPEHSSSVLLRIGAWGELGLDGTIKPIGQMTRALHAAWSGHLTLLFISASEASTAAQVFDLLSQSSEFPHPVPRPIAVSTLQHCWALLKNPQLCSSQTSLSAPPSELHCSTLTPSLAHQKIESLEPDLIQPLMLLSPSLERTLSLAVTGGHHLLLLGPQGAGKSHAFDWLTQLQPSPSLSERIQHQLLHELLPRPSAPSNTRRISPQVRPAALLGSTQASTLRPGEYSMAHGGLLMADEFLEWARDSRESLREPLERRTITLSRIQGCVELPASFLFAANGNLCPCGGWPQTFPIPSTSTHPIHPAVCQCSFSTKKKYLARLSGPILDRIDLVTLLIPQLSASPLIQVTPSYLNMLKEKIHRTQAQLIQRWGCLPGHMSSNTVEVLLKNQLQVTPDATVFKNLSFSSLRSRHKVTRIALTLAALDEQTEPKAGHWLEAQHYRSERLFNPKIEHSSQ